MAKLGRIIELLCVIAPPRLALDFDNSGLNVGDIQDDVTGITVCLDVTKQVIDEAIESGNNLIISHHPIIFSPIKNLVAGIKTNDVVAYAIQKRVNLYSMHTNLDSVEGGINDAIAKLLDIKNAVVLDEIENGVGIGRIGDVEQITIKQLCDKINSRLDTYCLTTKENLSKTITKCCVVNGAGASEDYLYKAKLMDAQVFISGEIKRHEALYATQIGLPIIEVSHFATENFYMPLLKEKIDAIFKTYGVDIKVKITQACAEIFDCVVQKGE